VDSRGLGVRMLTLRSGRALVAIGLAVAVYCGHPLVNDLLTSVPASRVVNCRVKAIHRLSLDVTLESGQALVLAQENVPNPAQCVEPGTAIEKVRGEFGYRLNGRQYFWESKGNRYFVILTVAGLLVAAGGLAVVVREKRAG